MQLDQVHYHGWKGKLRPPIVSCLAIVRVSLLQVLRTRGYWLVLALGAMRFLAYFAVIYFITQLPTDERMQRNLFRIFGFTADGDSDQDNGFIRFIVLQNVIVMILLAFSGSQLIGSDFRQKTLPFYLSRRIDKVHYIIGKLAAASSLVCIMTVLPALILFAEFAVLSPSPDYLSKNIGVVYSVLAFGAVLCVVNSIWLVTISAYLQRIVPITITWASLFLLMALLGNYLEHSTNDPKWRLLDLWGDMRLVGRLCFNSFRDDIERDLSWWAAGILALTCAVSLAALTHRVRAVDVVE